MKTRRSMCPRNSPYARAASAWRGLAWSVTLAAGSLHAQVATLTDQASFLSATGALAEPDVPSLGLIGRTGATYTLGHLTFAVSTTDPATALIMQDSTSLNPGNEVLMSSVEDLDVYVDHPITSIGFFFVEGTTPEFCTPVCPCTDATFHVTLLLGNEPVAATSFNAPDDALAFYGLLSCALFDHVQFRDTSLACDNEMWGRFWIGAAPCGPTCDSVDFNNDGLFPDTADIDDFLSVFSGGTCTNDPDCGDIDFNNDALFPDTADIDALLSVFSGGPCV